MGFFGQGGGCLALLPCCLASWEVIDAATLLSSIDFAGRVLFSGRGSMMGDEGQKWQKPNPKFEKIVANETFVVYFDNYWQQQN